ncbi:unnamed protein product [Urochloa humidicola]
MKCLCGTPYLDAFFFPASERGLQTQCICHSNISRCRNLLLIQTQLFLYSGLIRYIGWEVTVLKLSMFGPLSTWFRCAVVDVQ